MIDALQDFEQEEAREKHSQKPQRPVGGSKPPQTNVDRMTQPVPPQINSSASPLDDLATMEFDADDILTKALHALQMGGNAGNGDDSNLEDSYDISEDERKMLNGFAENMQEFLQGLEQTDRQQNNDTENKSFQDTIRDTVNMLKQNTDNLNVCYFVQIFTQRRMSTLKAVTLHLT